MINLVTGGAGFIGSNLIQKLLNDKEKVFCIDNFCTGSKRNIEHFIDHPNFTFINQDICKPINLNVDRIWHFASPASPIYYQENPIETTKTIFLGTQQMLEMAKKNNCRILIASSSEIYGLTSNNSQSEEQLGYIDTVSRRSCYGEAKRLSETISFDYFREYKLDIRVVRLFNTYGPKMLPKDGRVISNFIWNPLNKEKIEIFGSGEQTRSFCFIDDIIDGLVKLMDSNYNYPINLGNPFEEHSINNLFKIIQEILNDKLTVKYSDPREYDVLKRKPNIAKANRILNWEPKTTLKIGLLKTIKYFKKEKKYDY